MSKILVNSNQKGNPALKWLTGIPWEWIDSSASSSKDKGTKLNVVGTKFQVDYQVGNTIGVLFLGVQYHRLHPEYIYDRIKAVNPHSYRLRIVILYLGDMKDNEKAIAASLREVTRLGVSHNFTVVCAWAWEEVAKILELLKNNEFKPCDRLKPDFNKKEWTMMQRLESVLCKIKAVNKTDSVTLITHFGSLAAISQASLEDLIKCPGIAKLKAQRIYDTFHKPIRIASQTNPEVDDDDDDAILLVEKDEENNF